jgi:hypothetical protein
MKTLYEIESVLKKIGAKRAKIIVHNFQLIEIFISMKFHSDIKNLSKRIGVLGCEYNVKKLKWHECWFKRFKIQHNKG